MREHMGLYRGKRIDNGEWVVGNLFIPDEVSHRKAPTEILVGTNVVRISHAVDPNTIGECTGLRDKNGKLIFEGDVVRVRGVDLPHWIDYGEIREVKYRNGAFAPFDEYDSDCNTYVLAGDCEIIGNVIDNPEILKGGEQ